MSIRADLLHYFEEHPDKNVFLKELEKAFPDLTAKQIQQGVYQLYHTGMTDSLIVVQNGQIWKFNKNEKIDGETAITILQETPKGSVIFQWGEAIWIAKKVED